MMINDKPNNSTSPGLSYRSQEPSSFIISAWGDVDNQRDDKMNKHTKGKWTVEKGGYGYIIKTLKDYPNYAMASLNTKQGYSPKRNKPYSDDELKANANLIANAPEMLEVLKAVNKYNWDCNQGRLDDEYKRTMRFGGLWRLVINMLEKLDAYETYPEVEGGE